jgi:hypothetical protein
MTEQEGCCRTIVWDDNIAGGLLMRGSHLPDRCNAWQVARITAALEDARSGAAGIPHERVEAWMVSWETDQELPRPEAKQ